MAKKRTPITAITDPIRGIVVTGEANCHFSVTCIHAGIHNGGPLISIGRDADIRRGRLNADGECKIALSREEYQSITEVEPTYNVSAKLLGGEDLTE